MNIVPVQQCRSLDGWAAIKVESESNPGHRYTVMVNPWHDPRQNICECRGFHYRGECYHQLEASARICGWHELDGPEEQTPKERRGKVCPRCSERTMWTMENIDDD